MGGCPDAFLGLRRVQAELSPYSSTRGRRGERKMTLSEKLSWAGEKKPVMLAYQNGKGC